MDRPDREKIDLIFDGCYSRDLSACPKHTIFQRGKAVNEILSLIEEAKHALLERIEELEAQIETVSDSKI